MQQIDVAKSPFKFLCPYEKNDKEIFFERDSSSKELYKYIIKNRVVLIYGSPDCGKTSLVKCGMANWFDVTEWMPFYICRGSNINHSLGHVLNNSEALLQSFIAEKMSPESITEALMIIEKRCLRPVYLIFDQFEETLLKGNDDEINTFILILKRILSSSLTQSCHLVFVIKEEYLARLRIFEKAISGFSDRRIRIEPLIEKEISSVILQSCIKFNITLKKPEEQIELIMRNISDRYDITLSYLHVYMDQLWRDDYVRTYPNGYTGNLPYAPLEFTTDEINMLGNIREVMRNFLANRFDVIWKNIKNEDKFPNADIETIKNITDAFVNENGANQPIPYTRHGFSDEIFKLSDTAPRYIRELPAELFYAAIRQLEINGIIRINGYNMELSNGLITELVFDGRPPERRQLHEISKVIISQFENFKSTRQYLTGRQIRAYEDFVSKLNLEEKHLEFFKKSKERFNRSQMLKVAIILIGIILVTFFLSRRSVLDSTYALYYLGDTVNTMNNKIHALRLTKYIYDEKKDSKYADVIKQNFIGIFQSQQIQQQFSDFTKTLASTNVKHEDVDISENGDFILIADTYTSSNNVNFTLYKNGGDIIDTFKNVTYAYFINHSSKILLAIGKESSKDSLSSQYKEYPDRMLIYDCLKPGDKSHTLVINDGFLLPKGTAMTETESDYDSYRVRLTNAGNLLVPFFKRNSKDFFDMQLRVYKDQAIVKDIPSNYTVSISKDGKRFGTGASGKETVMTIFNESGEQNEFNGKKDTIKDADFADFTANGSIIYTRRGNVFLRNSEKNNPRQYYVSLNLNYAWANGKDERYILTTSNDSLFLIDTYGAGIIKRYKEKFIGVNFQEQFFFSNKPGSSVGYSGQGYLLQKRLFSGHATDSFYTSGKVQNIKYNDSTGELLILTDSNNLQLLGKNLKVKASFQLTANDLFGFSKNGNKFYYVRDNWLSVFSISTKLIDLSDFHSTYNWLEQREKEGEGNKNDADFHIPLKTLRKQYDLNWPSRSLF
ncbi:MAG: hypothetical protein ABIN89_08345 [Chitinophagaceae bacterium]